MQWSTSFLEIDSIRYGHHIKNGTFNVCKMQIFEHQIRSNNTNFSHWLSHKWDEIFENGTRSKCHFLKLFDGHHLDALRMWIIEIISFDSNWNCLEYGYLSHVCSELMLRLTFNGKYTTDSIEGLALGIYLKFKNRSSSDDYRLTIHKISILIRRRNASTQNPPTRLLSYFGLNLVRIGRVFLLLSVT